MQDDWKDVLIAHISEDGKRIQTVLEHLNGTARRAEEFARPFGGQEQARLAGNSHDIGKASATCQRRIRGSPERVDHSTAGMQEAMRMRQHEVAFAVAGHHGGLPDLGGKADPSDAPTLRGRMKRAIEPCDAWRREVELCPAARPSIAQDAFSQAFYTRMLFSALVDADYLDTEAFMRGDVPRGGYEGIASLLGKLKRAVEPWQNPTNALNAKRNEILRACFETGESAAPGLYALTVPTGGGKTVSSLAFALAHAKAHNRSRVIYVIPYTSIIDQTVDVFRGILGDENVLEHHCGVDFSMEEDEVDPAKQRRQLATENWDAPVIVTTAVQFFESLFSNRPSRCRKLHNIADSVVIFDEVQTLPVGYLRPCVAAIGQLVRFYGVTAVLCTATQPALDPLFDELAAGLKPREICPDPPAMYRFFRRTTLRHAGELAEESLVADLSQTRQALCVVNRRATAQRIFRQLPEEGRFCLTTLLCPVDRRRLLAQIRERLAAGEVCRVVSTSLIEAGVDVDFPAAWREEAGLDSILQTAGRCNREGRRAAGESIVTIFRLSGQEVMKMIRPNVDAAREVLDAFEDPAGLDAIEKYFAFYRTQRGDSGQDVKQILKCFEEHIFPFATVAQAFRLIESPTVPVYIPIGEAAEALEQLRRGKIHRGLYRKLGPYAVNVYPDHLGRLVAAGAVEYLSDGSAVLRDMQAYSRETGLAMDVETGVGQFV